MTEPFIKLPAGQNSKADGHAGLRQQTNTQVFTNRSRCTRIPGTEPAAHHLAHRSA
ncbi:hypothetical protein ES703_45740 [subsurface metagenome]